MNFLSHYYLLEEKENHDLIVGNLMPDLMRGFSKIYRQEVKPNTVIHSTDIVKGIHFHLATDDRFHNHDFFDVYCAELKSIIAAHQLPMTKNFIVSHVLLELIIDQILIEQDLDLANNFYNSLDKAVNNELEDKIKMTVSRQNSSKIISIFKGFKEHKYAYSLLEKNGIQQALYHIIGRRIGISFDDPKWENAIYDGKLKIMEVLPSFLIELKNELNDA